MVVFDHNGALFLASGTLQLSMSYVRCLEKRDYVIRLLPLVVSLKHVSVLSDQVEIYTVLDPPYSVLSLYPELGSLGRDCDFVRRMRTGQLPVFNG